MSTFTDPRDGNTYKTVEINRQVWLGENLRYRGPAQKFNNWIIEEKDFYYPPNGDRNNIKEYGCLYTWDNAIKACPTGWHLPSKTDFEKLLRVAGNTDRTRFVVLTGQNRKGDSLEFDALPAGYYYGFVYYDIGCDARFWSSTELDSSYAYSLDVVSSRAGVGYSNKVLGYSVRCIKD